MSFGHQVLESKYESEHSITARRNLNTMIDNLSKMITECSVSFLEWKRNIAAQKSLELAVAPDSPIFVKTDSSIAPNQNPALMLIAET